MGEAVRNVENPLEIQVTSSAPGEVTLGGTMLASELGPWSARTIDDQRFMVMGARAKSGAVSPSSSGSLSSALYKQVLLGLIQDGWTGLLYVDTFHGIKRIYLHKGQIVFAGSSIIDDRLGEILYREARITLDQLTFATSQVTKSQRFGQILVSKGGMSDTQLWSALIAQVQQIIRSTFMVGHVFLEIDEQGQNPVTEVAMNTSAKEMVQDMFCFGVGFRNFLDSLVPTSQIVPTMELASITEPHLTPGTFLGDFLEMIDSKPTVEQVLNASKLIDIYTVSTLYQLNCLGLCKVLSEVDHPLPNTSDLAPIRNKIEAYSYVLNAVNHTFKNSGKTFPANEIRVFVRTSEQGVMPYIHLNDDFHLAREAITGIYAQCQAYPDRIPYFTMRVESMIQFLFQIAGDHLQFSVANQLRQEYRSVST